MRYVCICYDDKGAEPKVGDVICHSETRSENHPVVHDLLRRGELVDSIFLESAERGTLLKVRQGRVSLSDPDAIRGDQARPGSFAVIDARDLNDAIRIASKLPSAREGTIEIRPIRSSSAVGQAQG